MKKTKLELTWTGKDKRPKLEPRILLEGTGKSYHAKHKITENDIFDNKLIFGEKLLALKVLEQEYTGRHLTMMMKLLMQKCCATRLLVGKTFLIKSV